MIRTLLIKKYFLYVQKLTLLLLALSVISISHAQTTIFYQNFDGAFTVINAGGASITQASCIPTTQTWTGLSTCTSCLGGGTTCYYFYRDDQTINSGQDKCGVNQAPGCFEAGSYAIYFDCYDANIGGTASVTSPTIDLSAYASSCYSVTLKFYYFNKDETSVSALFSNNGGTSFTSQGGSPYNVTSNSWQSASITIPAAYCVSNFEVRFTGVSNYVNYPIAIDEVTITETSTAPSTDATLNAFSGVTCTGTTVNWTNGNGADRIVVAYPNSTITSPVSGTAYTANTSYGSGTAIGAGFVVYNGTGATSVAVTGLTASTTYYYAVFEYNAPSCYNTPGPSSSQATTSCCATTQASGLSYSNINCSTITLNWTNGNGADRIVVAYPNSTITSPTNGTTYTANAAYTSGTAVGAGYVVYNGTGSSVTVTGLAASTTYYFAVFEYNTTACYLTPGLSSSQATTTCACPTTQATSLVYSGVTCSATTLTWTNGNGGNRLVIAYPNSTITSPTNGTFYTQNATYGSGSSVGAGFVVYDGSASTVTVSGLSASTTYYYAVFEYISTSCYHTPALSSSQATIACPCPTTQATSLTYTNVNCTSLTVNWIDGNGANRIVVAYPNSTITSPVNGTVYTPNTVYGSGTALGAGRVVYAGSGNSVSITGLTAGTTYWFAVFEYNTVACYLTPALSSSQATTAACCPTTQASAIKFANIGCNSYIVNWTNGNGADRLVVVYPNSTITSPTNGTTYTANYNYGSGTAVGAGYVVYKGTGNTVTLLGLSASTTYYVGIFEYTTTSCYLVPGVSANRATTACTCPFMSTAMTDGCNSGCNEGDSEFLLLNTCSYGWDNSAVAPTMDYGSTPTAMPTYTVSGTGDYTADATTTANLNSSNVACNGVFIDASNGGVVIPPWSYVLFCATGGGGPWCPSNYDFSGICPSGPIYVLYGLGGLQSSGNYLNHTAGTTRYFNLDFSPITGAGSCDQYYSYDAGSEANGDGAFETYLQPISTSTATPTAPNTYGQNCGLTSIMLPIKLLYFKAQYNAANHVVNLTWATSSEESNKQFVIEKTKDGENWQSVVTVLGAGNSTKTIQYSASDDSPFSGTSYYKVRQINFDGNSSTSQMEPVNVDLGTKNIIVAPNPANDLISVTFGSPFTGTSTVSIYDVTSRLVATKQVEMTKGSTTFQLDVSGFSNGVYFILINNGLIQLSTKFIINHHS